MITDALDVVLLVVDGTLIWQASNGGWATDGSLYGWTPSSTPTLITRPAAGVPDIQETSYSPADKAIVPDAAPASGILTIADDGAVRSTR